MLKSYYTSRAAVTTSLHCNLQITVEDKDNLVFLLNLIKQSTCSVKLFFLQWLY